MNDIKKDTNTNQVLIIKFNTVSLLLYKHIFYNFFKQLADYYWYVFCKF